MLAIIYHIYTSGYAVGPANGGHARVDANGVTVALADQDRTKCNRSQIDEGLGLIEMAMQRRALGPYQIKAAIAACHVQGEVSHWPQIVLLYDSLLRLEPTAVAPQAAVALSEAGWPEATSRSLDTLAAELKDYQSYHAARAELLSRTGHLSEAAVAYAVGIDLAGSEADAAFLRRRGGLLVTQAGSAWPAGGARKRRLSAPFCCLRIS